MTEIFRLVGSSAAFTWAGMSSGPSEVWVIQALSGRSEGGTSRCSAPVNS